MAKAIYLSAMEWHENQLVPWTSRIQDNSYPWQLVPRATLTQDNPSPGQIVTKKTQSIKDHTWCITLSSSQDLNNLYPRQLVPRKSLTQDISYPKQRVPKTTRTCDKSYPRQLNQSTTTPTVLQTDPVPIFHFEWDLFLLVPGPCFDIMARCPAIIMSIIKTRWSRDWALQPRTRVDKTTWKSDSTYDKIMSVALQEEHSVDIRRVNVVTMDEIP